MINPVAALSTAPSAGPASTTAPQPATDATSLRPPSQRAANRSGAYPLEPNDFESLEAFASWKKQETDEVQELLLDMTVRNPDLVKNGIKGGVLISSASSPSSATRRSARTTLAEWVDVL